MANNLGGRIWYIDNVMAAPAEPNPVHIGDWSWQEMTAVGHRLQVVDAKGRIIIDVISKGANEVIGTTKLGWVDGLRVSILDSGNVTFNVHKG